MTKCHLHRVIALEKSVSAKISRILQLSINLHLTIYFSIPKHFYEYIILYHIFYETITFQISEGPILILDRKWVWQAVKVGHYNFSLSSHLTTTYRLWATITFSRPPSPLGEICHYAHMIEENSRYKIQPVMVS